MSLINAHKHIEEFLEESRMISGISHQDLIVLMKRARAVLTEASYAINPSQKKDEAISEIAPINFGLDLQKDAIFSVKSDEPGWFNGMLFAINTAKKMGAT